MSHQPSKINYLRSIIKDLRSTIYDPKAFTLLELMIVVSLIAILATAAIVLFNPAKQIQKGWDSQRKSDMATIKKVLEDFYNDKQCYPKPAEICYDGSSAEELDDGSYICHICGNNSSSPSLSPYISKVLCDPQNAVKPYLYHAKNNTCPKSYQIYTKLSNTQDSSITEAGCQGGCGPASSISDFTYNYCVASPNATCEPPDYPDCNGYSTLFIQETGACNTCKSGGSDRCDRSKTIYTTMTGSTCNTECRYK